MLCSNPTYFIMDFVKWGLCLLRVADFCNFIDWSKIRVIRKD